MKKIISIIYFSLLTIITFSQQKKFEYTGRYTPSITKDKLIKARFINEIMPEFSRYVVINSEDRAALNKQMELKDYLNGYTTYPNEFYSLPLENYNKIIYFISVEITAVCNGKTLKAISEDNILSPTQKNILFAADPGSDISIKFKYKYKVQAVVSPEEHLKIKEGSYTITTVPETEAAYAGGFEGITDYINENVFYKIPKSTNYKKIMQGIVTFTITENGQVVDAKLTETSKDPLIDKLFLNAISKMSKWSPAKDIHGKNTKQEYRIALAGGGC